MRKLLLLLTLTLISAISYAQGIKGKVTDGKSGGGLPGVSITALGTNNGTVTDGDGNYSLPIPAGSYQLTFSFIGFETQTIRTNVSVRRYLM